MACWHTAARGDTVVQQAVTIEMVMAEMPVTEKMVTKAAQGESAVQVKRGLLEKMR